jgi:glycosyltransferase involved in cell wall biosynthesis
VRKNMLFVSSYIDLGGGETALLNLVEHLDHDRWWPHLLVRAEGQLAQSWRKHGWPVHIAPWRGASTWFVPALWAQLPIRRRIQTLIHEQQIALLHSDYHTLPMALPAAAAHGIPTVWWCWGWWFRPKLWQRSFFHRPQITFALSQAIKQGFLGQPPFMPPEQIPVVYPGVDSQRFRPSVDGTTVRQQAAIPPDAPVVALIARFQDVKGHDTFQAMARLVLQAVPDARFIVAGENTQTSADNAYKTRILESAAHDPRLRSALTYLGFRADVEQVMAAADVVVCSSHFESYGMVNIEAMSSGKPVVSTNQGGPAETVADGETGFLVPARDPAALAEKVISLLRDPALRQRMGAAGRARVERLFSVEAMAQQYMQAIDPLLPK